MRILVLLAAMLSLVAAEPYRPLGIGLGDLIRSDAWKSTLASLKERGFAPSAHPNNLVPSEMSHQDVWNAHVQQAINMRLKVKGLKPLATPALFVGKEQVYDAAGLIDDRFLAQFQVPLVDGDGRTVAVDYRVSTGEIYRVNAEIQFPIGMPNAKDHTAIGMAMCNGFIGMFGPSLQLYRQAAVGSRVDKTQQSPEACTQAVKEVLASTAGRQEVWLVFHQPSGPTGSLVITVRDGKKAEFRLELRDESKRQNGSDRTLRQKQFEDEVTRGVEAEARRQTAGPKPTGSTEGF